MHIDYKRRLLLTAMAWGPLGAVLAGAAQPPERVIKVIAKRFDFTPGEIHLERGVPVLVELSSLDVPMGFNVPDFGVRSDIVPGKISRLRLNPDKRGQFIFLCDIFCGAGHESMNGMITVS